MKHSECCNVLWDPPKNVSATHNPQKYRILTFRVSTIQPTKQPPGMEQYSWFSSNIFTPPISTCKLTIINIKGHNFIFLCFAFLKSAAAVIVLTTITCGENTFSLWNSVFVEVNAQLILHSFNRNYSLNLTGKLQV